VQFYFKKFRRSKDKQLNQNSRASFPDPLFPTPETRRTQSKPSIRVTKSPALEIPGAMQLETKATTSPAAPTSPFTKIKKSTTNLLQIPHDIFRESN